MVQTKANYDNCISSWLSSSSFLKETNFNKQSKHGYYFKKIKKQKAWKPKGLLHTDIH